MVSLRYLIRPTRFGSEISLMKSYSWAFGAVMRLYLSRDLWVTVLASADVHGLEAALNVSARGELASALGEGIADGLDVAGF